MTGFNYIQPEKRKEILQKAVNDIYNPAMQKLVYDEVYSEIYDATKEMSNSEKYEYLRKRLERERRDLLQLQNLYKKLVKRAAEVDAGSLLPF